ncbi:uncharacterized protein LOC131940898 [Physella acuta]|uniref:uncharacterized protein LOC131940898 n=1 Tax=Physella acuta TaxID=109671 RepID=UPI0027DC27E7|nr:uncharacterized protein LOC131940898 [Physella acuta]
MRYSDHLRLPGKDSRAAVNHSDLTRLHTYPSALSSRTLPPKATPTHIPVIMPQLVPGCPGQIVIRRPDTPDTDEDDLMGECPPEVVNAWPYRSPSVSPRHSPRHTPRHAPDVLRFADKDYMMPAHVRKILREEGIRDATAESWLKEREVWHWKSASLRHQEKSKHIKASGVRELPMINHQVSLVSGQQHYSTQHGTVPSRASTQEHRGAIIVASADGVGYSQSEVSLTNFDTSPMTSSAALSATLTSSPTLPSAQTQPTSVPAITTSSAYLPATMTSSAYLPATMTSSAYLPATMTSSDYLVTTKTSSVSLPDIVGSEPMESDAVDMEPDSPDPQGDLPRLVLISSKVPRCQSMARAVIKDGHVTCLVYDFDRWCFQDILDECQHRLENDFNGCKAQSVLLICKGGPGYLYMLRNFVLTPQKIGQPQYQCVRQ